MANSTRRSDEELRRLTLRIGDPHGQEGLVMEIPAGVSFVDVLNIYAHPGWPEDKAYCAVCRGYRHRDGYTCLMSNGSLILAGSKCGSDLSGETFVHARKRLHDDVRRKDLLHDFDALVPKIESIIEGLSGWQQTVDAMSERRLRFKVQMPDLFQELKMTANRSDRMLTTHERVRDHAGEAHYARRNKQPSPRPFYTHVEHGFAPLHGAPFFIPLQPDVLLKKAFEALYRTVGASRSTQSHSLLKLGLARRAVDEAREHVESIWMLRAAMIAFFSKDNLLNVVQWANNKSGRIRYRAGDISITEIGVSTIHLSPGELPEIGRAPLDALRQAGTKARP